MSKNRINIYSILLISIVAIFGAVFFLRPHSRLLLSILPPSGLYDPLLKQSINLQKENVKYEEKIDRLYVGTYFVGVYVNNPSSSVHVIDSAAILRLSIAVSNDEIHEIILSDWTDYVGSGKGRSEIILGYFKVPEDVPKMKSSKISILVEKSDSDFDQKYGPLELFIQRSVDL